MLNLFDMEIKLMMMMMMIYMTSLIFGSRRSEVEARSPAKLQAYARFPALGTVNSS